MIITLTGASGVGKTTIAGELLKNLPVNAQMVPSYTIRKFRKPRPTDLPGEYKYVTRFWFWLLNATGSFLWTVYPHGNSYGTTKRWVIRALRDDNTVYVMILFDAIKKLNIFAEKTDFSNKIFSFYILSPPDEILKERLRSRGDKENEVEKRLKDCAKWDSEAKASGIPYEFVKNEGTIEFVTEEVITIFLRNLGRSDCYF
mgnify:CR=1 FL=1